MPLESPESLLTKCGLMANPTPASRRSSSTPEEVVDRELDRYKVEIAALSETRLAEEGLLKEVGAGYTITSSKYAQTPFRLRLLNLNIGRQIKLLTLYL